MLRRKWLRGRDGIGGSLLLEKVGGRAGQDKASVDMKAYGSWGLGESAHMPP